MRVIATKTGFDGKQVRQEGDEFDMPDGSKALWFAPVKEAPVKQPTKAGKAAPPDGNDLA